MILGGRDSVRVVQANHVARGADDSVLDPRTFQHPLVAPVAPLRLPGVGAVGRN